MGYKLRLHQVTWVTPPGKESIGGESLGGVGPDVCSLFVRRSKNFRLTQMTIKTLDASGIVCTKEII
jgi:hypothetical protein